MKINFSHSKQAAHKSSQIFLSSAFDHKKIFDIVHRSNIAIRLKTESIQSYIIKLTWNGVKIEIFKLFFSYITKCGPIFLLSFASAAIMRVVESKKVLVWALWALICFRLNYWKRLIEFNKRCIRPNIDLFESWNKTYDALYFLESSKD